MVVSAKVLKPEDRLYTYEDYLTWDDDVRYELINGVAYALAAPNLKHQEVLRELTLSIGNYLKGKSCKLFMSPVDVKPFPNKNDIVLQPDLVVVCDKNKLDGKAVVGIPDIVIEILSPSTAQKDKLVKYNIYLDAGVLEYWIVDADAKVVNVFKRQNGHYLPFAYGEEDKIETDILEGLEINLGEIFGVVDAE